MQARTANKILFFTTIVSIGMQLMMGFAGVHEVIPLLLGGQLPILLIPLISVLALRVNVTEELRLKDVGLRTVLFAFLIILCAYPMISLLNMISMLFVDNAVVGITANVYKKGYVFSMIIMALLPAIGEEFLMRGVLYHSYRKRSPILAWLLTSLLFGLFHMNFNQMPYTIFLGLIMVLMVEAGNSLAVSMWIHFFMNGIATTVGYFSAAMPEARAGSDTVNNLVGRGAEVMPLLIQMTILAVLTLPLIFLIIWATFRINGRTFSEAFQKKERNRCDETRIWDIWLFLSIVVMMIVTIINTVA